MSDKEEATGLTRRRSVLEKREAAHKSLLILFFSISELLEIKGLRDQLRKMNRNNCFCEANGNHVQILTKGDGRRDFDLLDNKDWFGVTISCMSYLADASEPGAIAPEFRMWEIVEAHKRGIKTWVSFEPVICPDDIFTVIDVCHDYIDKVKIVKLNYHPSDINWKEFGLQITGVCEAYHMDYYIKDSLRKEMEK